MSAASPWAQFMTTYRGAQVARDVMRGRDASAMARDEATIRYGRSCDQMMDLLETMSEQQVLTQIGVTLNGRGR